MLRGRLRRSRISSKTKRVSAVFLTESCDNITPYLAEKVFSIPSEHDKPSSLIRWLLPLPISSFCHKSRFQQMALLGADETKFGLIEEHSLHILIDVIFVTITSQPIYNGSSLPVQMGCSSWFCKFVTVWYYFTTTLQILSILANGIVIFAFVEVPTPIFRSWFLRRGAAVLFANRFHTFALYCFLIAFAMYPLATQDDLGLGLACTGVVLLTTVSFSMMLGTYMTPGFYDCLHSLLKIRLFPENKAALRHLAEADADLFIKSFRISSVELAEVNHISLSEFLEPLDLSALEPMLTEQKIGIADLVEMDNDDYRSLKIKIGDRNRIREALRELSHFRSSVR